VRTGIHHGPQHQRVAVPDPDPSLKAHLGDDSVAQYLVTLVQPARSRPAFAGERAVRARRAIV